MFDLMVISLFFSMVLGPCVVASVSSHLEGKTANPIARKTGKPSREARG